jgi:thiol-disulfide isomerase/thioredoxin
MKRIFVIHLFLFLAFCSKGQVNINISLGGLTNDTIYFGKIFGKRQVRQTPILKNAKGTYDVTFSTDIEPGFYAILYDINSVGKAKSSYYFQIAIDKDNKKYNLYCDPYNPSQSIQITGDQGFETFRYYEYINKYDSLAFNYHEVIDSWLTTKDDRTYFPVLVAKEQQMKDYQNAYIKKYPGTLTSKFVALTKTDFPLYQGILDDQIKKRQEFFDTALLKNFDPKINLMWMSKNGIDFLDLYTIRSADKNIAKASERSVKILDLLYDNNRPVFEYYLNYLLNSFTKMTKFNMELVALAISKAFIESGKADFYTKEELSKFTLQVANIERLKVGGTLPDTRLYYENGNPYNVYDLKTKYGLLVFWSPDCSHCKKELPILKRLATDYKSKGLGIMTVCTKRAEKTASCYEHLKNENLDLDFINLNDKSNMSRFNVVYDVTSFPCIYIFNTSTKEIYMRRKGDVEEMEFRNILDNLP